MVFALIFGVHREARASAVPFVTPPAVSTSADLAKSVVAADLGVDVDAPSASQNDAKIAWYENSDVQVALPAVDSAAARVVQGCS